MEFYFIFLMLIIARYTIRLLTWNISTAQSWIKLMLIYFIQIIIILFYISLIQSMIKKKPSSKNIRFNVKATIVIVIIQVDRKFIWRRPRPSGSATNKQHIPDDSFIWNVICSVAKPLPMLTTLFSTWCRKQQLLA